MILVDTSAWVEFLRDTGSKACRRVDALLGTDEIAVTDPVVMEVLAGARDDTHLHLLRGLMGRCRLLPVASVDYETAAALYRRCRARGATVRSLTDCLIAAVALRNDTPVLHADRDYTVLARHTELRPDR